MNIIYKKADKSDSSIIKEMLYHAIYLPEGKAAPSKNIIEIPELLKYYKDWGKESDAGWIAFNENNPIGAAWIRLLTGEDKGYGYVDENTPELSIAVLPEYRNKGIGSKLLEKITEEAKIKFKAVCLSVTKNNPARNLYKRFGFIEIDEIDNSITMIKRLDGTHTVNPVIIVI